MSLALIQRVKDLEARVSTVEAHKPTLSVETLELLEFCKTLRERFTKLEMQYRALNARLSKGKKEE
jgi:BMFP domain-containing protein YqiC